MTSPPTVFQDVLDKSEARKASRPRYESGARWAIADPGIRAFASTRRALETYSWTTSSLDGEGLGEKGHSGIKLASDHGRTFLDSIAEDTRQRGTGTAYGGSGALG